MGIALRGRTRRRRWLRNPAFGRQGRCRSRHLWLPGGIQSCSFKAPNQLLITESRSILPAAHEQDPGNLFATRPKVITQDGFLKP